MVRTIAHTTLQTYLPDSSFTRCHQLLFLTLEHSVNLVVVAFAWHNCTSAWAHPDQTPRFVCFTGAVPVTFVPVFPTATLTAAASSAVDAVLADFVFCSNCHAMQHPNVL